MFLGLGSTNEKELAKKASKAPAVWKQQKVRGWEEV